MASTRRHCGTAVTTKRWVWEMRRIVGLSVAICLFVQPCSTLSDAAIVWTVVSLTRYNSGMMKRRIATFHLDTFMTLLLEPGLSVGGTGTGAAHLTFYVLLEIPTVHMCNFLKTLVIKNALVKFWVICMLLHLQSAPTNQISFFHVLYLRQFLFFIHSKVIEHTTCISKCAWAITFKKHCKVGALLRWFQGRLRPQEDFSQIVRHSGSRLCAFVYCLLLRVQSLRTFSTEFIGDQPDGGVAWEYC